MLASSLLSPSLLPTTAFLFQSLIARTNKKCPRSGDKRVFKMTWKRWGRWNGVCQSSFSAGNLSLSHLSLSLSPHTLAHTHGNSSWEDASAANVVQRVLLLASLPQRKQERIERGSSRGKHWARVPLHARASAILLIALSPPMFLLSFSFPLLFLPNHSSQTSRSLMRIWFPCEERERERESSLGRKISVYVMQWVRRQQFLTTITGIIMNNYSFPWNALLAFLLHQLSMFLLLGKSCFPSSH